MDALMRRLQGFKDARGPEGIYSRGKNVYNGGSSAAHRGSGYGMGRPKKGALIRRQGRRRA